MESKDTTSKAKEQERSKSIISNNKLKKLKSDYFIQKVFNYMTEGKTLEIIKYNKSIQKRINININNYKDYYLKIEIEIIPINNEGKFINIKEEDKEYYHIYFNDNKRKEIKRNYLNEENKVSKINIVIDYQVTSFSHLFDNCKRIKSIYFKKFYRNNITDMSGMFYGCSSLKKLNLNNFNTENVTNMNDMFRGCSSLKELNLSNFNTHNVTSMSCMFFGCLSLNKLNLNNFNTNNVSEMSCMFSECSSLKKLNLNNFNTNNVTAMIGMFSGCLSLKELNINNFKIKNTTNMIWMFSRCSDELKLKIKRKFKNFKENAFY